MGSGFWVRGLSTARERGSLRNCTYFTLRTDSTVARETPLLYHLLRGSYRVDVTFTEQLYSLERESLYVPVRTYN